MTTPHGDAEGTGRYLGWDGKLPASLRALLTKPGFLTEEFLAGRRARWLSPLRLYLICSVVYFLSGPLIERMTGHSQKAVAQIKITGDSTERRIISDSSAFVNNPDFQNNVIARAVGGPSRLWYFINHQQEMQDNVAAAIPRAMFVLMPIFALLTLGAWQSTGRRYPAHLAFSLHLHATFFAALTLASIIAAFNLIALDLVVQLGVLVYSTWYTIVAFKRTLGGTSSQLFWRSTIVGLVYAPLALVVTMAAVAVALIAK